MKKFSKTLLIAGLLTWYAILGGNPHKKFEEKYTLPEEIRVIDSSVPYETRLKDKGIEKIIKTKDIPFTGDFKIKTDRYRIVKDTDWLPSRIIGHVASLPGKLLFWDWNYAWGQDEDRSKAALAMLETDKDIKGLTLRLNHNEGFYDMYRMFTEKQLRERNNIVARATLGTLVSLGDEIWAEFTRGSYYNPLTKTVVCYSNIESVTAHEIGHHKDFERFDSDWAYMLGRILPPIMLYQEWQASQNAKNIMSKEDEWQFKRYLIPAFATYVLFSIAATKKLFSKKKEDK